jgi:hypothetical protein
LERAQPVLPVIRNMPERQSAEDYIRFLKKLDKVCSKRKTLHIATDY